MAEVSKYQPGEFSWVELATNDSSAAKAFYSELFGWKPVDNPVGENMVYTMLQSDGKDAGALYQMDKDQKARGVPPHWNSYVTVNSADEAVAKAKSLGGQALSDAFDVFDAGRMAILQDPLGATFAVWQANQHIGAKVVNSPGAFCWNELYTTDTKKAKDFYTGLFGWSAQEQDMGPAGLYTIYTNGERMNGGMMKIPEEFGPMPPNWLVYFSVEDCDASADKAKSLGANVMVPPTDIPDVGRFALVTDPQGAAFAVIKLNNPEDHE